MSKKSKISRKQIYVAITIIENKNIKYIIIMQVYYKWLKYYGIKII